MGYRGLVTFPLQLFPIAIILEGLCFPDRNSGHKWTKNGIRAALTLLCMGVATIGYTSVDNLVSLIGALGCVPLAIIFPALFHYASVYCGAAPSSSYIIEDVINVPDSDAHINGEASGLNSSLLAESFTTDEKPLGSRGYDLLIVAFGLIGVTLAVVMAIQSWITSEFEFQTCVLRNTTEPAY